MRGGTIHINKNTIIQNAISQNGDFIIGESDTTSGSSHAFVSSCERCCRRGRCL
ncbi:hypothetical protein NWL46_003970 [Salmonella enterica]|nr:hypothetical protein [Salmonella enterica]EJS6906044.1 hypothetical protein [Salmonella enterica]